MSESTHSCRDGSHACEIIASAVEQQQPWIALANGESEILWCARGNFAAMGIFFETIGTAIRQMDTEEPPGDCALCKAHVKAVRAAMYVWERSMRESGFTKHGRCQ